MNLIRPSNRKLNVVRTGNNEGPKHKEMKETICSDLEILGIDYVTEAIFKNGSRADIVVLELFKVIEIAVSESDASLEAKKNYYPEGLKIEVVRA